MRPTRLAPLFLVVALGSLSIAGGCPLIPEIEERIVELAVGGSTTAEFVASGELNNHSDSDTVDVGGDVDIAALLDDAGIDAADVTDVTVTGVAYRVTQVDPAPNRRINNGNVTITRGNFGIGIGRPGEIGALGGGTVLVSNFNVDVNSATDWTTAPLTAGGVTILNALLDDLLNEAKTGVPATNTDIIYDVSGTSTPGDVETNFRYEVRLDISIVGKVKLDIVN